VHMGKDNAAEITTTQNKLSNVPYSDLTNKNNSAVAFSMR